MPASKVGEGHAAWLLALVGAAGAILGGVATGGFNYLSHQYDLDAKMIELSRADGRDRTPTRMGNRRDRQARQISVQRPTAGSTSQKATTVQRFVQCVTNDDLSVPYG
jgi:hypothetical protein